MKNPEVHITFYLKDGSEYDAIRNTRIIDEELLGSIFKEINNLQWTSWSISVYIDANNNDGNPLGIFLDKRTLNKINDIDIDIYLLT